MLSGETLSRDVDSVNIGRQAGGMPRASRPYHHGDLRRALLDTALERIREAGSEGLTLRELARRAGVSHAAPYRHFPDRSALLAAVAEEGFAQLAAAMQQAGERGRTPLGRLRRAGLAYVEFARASPAHFRMMFGPEAVGAGGAAGLRTFSALAALVEGCQRAGDLRAGDSELLARMAWSLVHGIAELEAASQLGMRSAAELERFALRAMDALLAGLA